jgi:hypothetical protein
MSFSITIPLELRLKIWELTLDGPRSLQLFLDDGVLEGENGSPRYGKLNSADYCAVEYKDKAFPTSTIFFRRAKVPLTLHICQESRQFDLKFYTPLDIRGYFNFKTDELLISEPALWEYFGLRTPGWTKPDATYPILTTFKGLHNIAFHFSGVVFADTIEKDRRTYEYHFCRF